MYCHGLALQRMRVGDSESVNIKAKEEEGRDLISGLVMTKYPVDQGLFLNIGGPPFLAQAGHRPILYMYPTSKIVIQVRQ